MTARITDHESNEGLTLATIIGIFGFGVAAAFTIAVLAVQVIDGTQARLDHLNAVLEGVSFP